MTPALVIVRATVREHSRRKLIAFFSIISVLITVALIFFAANSQFDDFFSPSTGGIQVVAGFLGTFALIAAIATSMGNVGRPFNSGEALLILSRPVSRAQYVIGRFAGGLVVTAALCLLLALETQIVQSIAGQPAGILWEHWGVTVFNLTIVSAVTNLLSVFVATPIIAAVIAYLANQVFGVAEFLHRLTKAGILKGGFAVASNIFWIVTPKFLNSPFTEGQGQVVIDGREISMAGANSAGQIAWSLGWFGGLLALSLYFATRRDI